jgi:hypothetical protein
VSRSMYDGTFFDLIYKIPMGIVTISVTDINKFVISHLISSDIPFNCYDLLQPHLLLRFDWLMIL